MSGFIRRRLFQSLLIVAGVMLITFLLFCVAAGDPALVRLGKNASPAELEAVRTQLGSQLPLLFGRECLTEAFPSVDYRNGIPNLPGVTLPDSVKYEPGIGLRLKANEVIVFSRQLIPIESELRLRINGEQNFFRDFEASDTQVVLRGSEHPVIGAVRFFQLQKNPFRSQFSGTLGELISFQNKFPYVSFFNFGNSIVTQEPVREILGRCIGPSLALMIPVFLGELILGIILGLMATRYKDRWEDRLIMLGSVMGMSISYLAFILFGQYFLAYRLGWFPVWGFESPLYLVLPVIIGILSGLGGGVRFYRTVFVNELNREYLRTARAKGCSSFQIYVSHLLPNAMIPIISRISVVLPFLFTGSLLLEKFFGIPGLGFAGINALANADLQLLKAIVLMSTLIFVVVNLLTDILYAAADPRIRLGRRN